MICKKYTRDNLLFDSEITLALLIVCCDNWTVLDFPFAYCKCTVPCLITWYQTVFGIKENDLYHFDLRLGLYQIRHSTNTIDTSISTPVIITALGMLFESFS